MEDFDKEVIQSEMENFLPLLRPSLGRGDPSSSSSERRLISNYGLRLPEIALLWLHLSVRGFDVGSRRDQLLWTLFWLRVYAPESACVTHFRPTPTEKTYRAAVKKFVGFIANINFVRLIFEHTACCEVEKTALVTSTSVADLFRNCRSAGSADSKTGQS